MNKEVVGDMKHTLDCKENHQNEGRITLYGIGRDLHKIARFKSFRSRRKFNEGSSRVCLDAKRLWLRLDTERQ